MIWMKYIADAYGTALFLDNREQEATAVNRERSSAAPTGQPRAVPAAAPTQPTGTTRTGAKAMRLARFTLGGGSQPLDGDFADCKAKPCW